MAYLMRSSSQVPFISCDNQRLITVAIKPFIASIAMTRIKSLIDILHCESGYLLLLTRSVGWQFEEKGRTFIGFTLNLQCRVMQFHNLFGNS